MLKGIRVAIKWLTVGLLAGLLLAPRKGDETRDLLVDRAREYFKEIMGAAQGVADEAEEKVDDVARSFESDSRGYDVATNGVQ